MPVTTRLSLAEAVHRLEAMKVQGAPRVLRAIVEDVYKVALIEGERNINGGVLARTGPNAALARYWLTAMAMNRTITPEGLHAGLPASDLKARILAHRETGGTIKMRDKMLRIPLGPARTKSGFDRNDGINLKARIGGPLDHFFVFKAKSGNVFLAERAAARRKPPALVLHYLLRTQVTQQPHPWFSEAMKTAAGKIPGVIAKHLPTVEAP